MQQQNDSVRQEDSKVFFKDIEYRLGDCIGSGSYAKVFSAEKVYGQNSEKVALRIQKRFYPDEFELLERCRENSFLNCTFPKLNMTGRNLLITEYELFENNLTFFPQQEMNEQIILQIISTMNDALEDIHKKGYVHCDVKPDNIVYRKQETGYQFALCDFSSLQSLEQMKQPLFIKITPIYAAPEINLMGQTNNADQRQDVWSLGVTIYNINMKNENLFDLDTVDKRNNEEFIQEKLENIEDTRIKSIIQECLKQEKERRANYQKIRQLISSEPKQRNNSSRNFGQLHIPQNQKIYAIQTGLVPLKKLAEIFEEAEAIQKIREDKQKYPLVPMPSLKDFQLYI